MSNEDWYSFQGLPLHAQAEVMNAVFQTGWVGNRDLAWRHGPKLFQYIQSKPHIEERFMKTLAAVLEKRKHRKGTR